jgi:hypothetical protein
LGADPADGTATAANTATTASSGARRTAGV